MLKIDNPCAICARRPGVLDIEERGPTVGEGLLSQSPTVKLSTFCQKCLDRVALQTSAETDSIFEFITVLASKLNAATEGR